MNQCMKYTERLTHVLKRASKAGKLKLGFIGGSITQGCNPSEPKNAYVERVTKWFKEKFENVEVERINAGVGATGSLIGVHRAGRDIIQYKPDIVFIDFAANDIPPKTDTRYSYEGLIRKLLKGLPEAAFIEIFMTEVDGTNAQDEEREIADYYKLPRVSYADEIFEKIKEGVYKWEDIETDEVHPNDRGHGILTGLITDLIEYALKQEDNENPYVMPAMPLFTDKYDEAKLVEFQSVEAIEESGFKFVKQPFRTLNTGYEAERSGKVYFKCMLEARNIFLLYVNGTEKDRAKAVITINGTEKVIVDTFFKDGWGNYGDTISLVSGNQKQNYTVEICLPEEETGKALTLLGFLIS